MLKHHVAPFVDAKGEYSRIAAINFFALIFCLMVGTASLPHILMRYFTTPSVREARKSVAWSLFFIFLLYFTAPSYAAFAKLEVYQQRHRTTDRDLPAWVQTWGAIGLVGVCDAPNAAELFKLCAGVAGNADGVLQLSEFRIDNDAIVLATPEIAGLPYVIAGLVAAGGLAAALSTADGLLLAIANALSHDVYYRMIDSKAGTRRRLIVARTLLILVAIGAAYTASTRPSGILPMVAWAFSLAASGLFPALVMGIWWKRTTAIGACCGMLAGFGVCLFYLIGTHYFPEWFISVFGTGGAREAMAAGQQAIAEATAAGGTPESLAVLQTAHFKAMQAQANWWGIRNISCGLFGIPVAFVVTWLVSLITPAPSREMQDFIDSVRVPRGAVRHASGQAGIE